MPDRRASAGLAGVVTALRTGRLISEKETIMKESDVVELDPAMCLSADDNRPARRPTIGQLMEGIRIHGQQVPGLVCPHPSVPGKYLVLDGVGRAYACGQLGKLFRAIMLKAPVSELERIELRSQHNAIRTNMSMEDIADDASRFMELTNCSQEEAARRLTLSTATVSRALNVKRRIPAELKPLAERVKPSIVSMIASLADVEAMRQALEHANTPDKNGKLPTRDQMAVYLDRFKTKRPREAKPKTLKGIVNGRVVEFGIGSGESTESFIKFLNDLAKKLGKYSDLPVESLGPLLQG
jgi:ParB/RepB/Spo0J family partition protein